MERLHHLQQAMKEKLERASNSTTLRTPVISESQQREDIKQDTGVIPLNIFPGEINERRLKAKWSKRIPASKSTF